MSKLNLKEYLEILVALHKDSLILENEIKALFRTKFDIEKEKDAIKYAFVNAHASKEITEKFLAHEQELERLKLGCMEDVKLTSEEENEAWDDFLLKNKIWTASVEDFTKPEEPVKPERPKKPIEPRIMFDMSRLDVPHEPDYQKGNIFNRKKLEAWNQELKVDYEKAVERYRESVIEYEQVKQEHEAALKEYSVACKTYKAAEKAFWKSYDKYVDRKKQYDTDLSKYNRTIKKLQIEKRK